MTRRKRLHRRRETIETLTVRQPVTGDELLLGTRRAIEGDEFHLTLARRGVDGIEPLVERTFLGSVEIQENISGEMRLVFSPGTSVRNEALSDQLKQVNDDTTSN